MHLNNFNLSVSIEELQQYGDQLLNHCLREDELKGHVRAEVSPIPRPLLTISVHTKKIEEAPPDNISQQQSDAVDNEKMRLSKSKQSLSPNESDGSSRPSIISNNTDTSPKWANGRYSNSMRATLNVDTPYRQNSHENDNKTPYHRMSDPKFQSTPTFTAPSRKLDALLDAPFASNERKSPANVDHYLPTPPNSVSPQFQSHQSSLADSASQ